MPWKMNQDENLKRKLKTSFLIPNQPEKTVKIGSRLRPSEKEELTDFLGENRDVFAWSPSDMPSINPAIACHMLHVDPTAKPVI